MDKPTPTQDAKAATRNLVVDGPPVWILTIIFAGLLAVSWGRGDPGAGLAVFAVGIVVALAAGAGLAGSRQLGQSGEPLRFTGAPRRPPPTRPKQVP